MTGTRCDKQPLSAVDFDYASPSLNFDRSKKGLVALLAPQDFNKSTALEVTAGGKLYNAVVEDEHVGKELLQNGWLKNASPSSP
jgi:structural maintenance of chromosome 2